MCENIQQCLYLSNSDYQSASRLCREYASTRGPGSTAKPGEHKFFLRLEPIISKRLEKATHENGFMWVNASFYPILQFSLFPFEFVGIVIGYCVKNSWVGGALVCNSVCHLSYHPVPSLSYHQEVNGCQVQSNGWIIARKGIVMRQSILRCRGLT